MDCQKVTLNGTLLSEYRDLQWQYNSHLFLRVMKIFHKAFTLP